MSERPTLLYLEGSPVERFIRDLSREHECRSIPSGSTSGIESIPSGILLIDASHGELRTARALKAANDGLEIIVLASEADLANPDLIGVYTCLPADIPAPLLARTIANACAHLNLEQGREQTASDLRELALELRELNEIGIRLSAELDTDSLLELILDKAREVTCSDAGSLYLVEEDRDGARRLRFKLAQNDSMPVPFKEFTLPIGPQSLSGYVALTGEILNLPNTYHLPPNSPFQINFNFDRQVGYYSKSMLVVPMKTPQGRIIGVFQLINCKPERGLVFSSAEEIERKVVPFAARQQDLAASLASQAAVALENSRLYQSIQNLFEGFVQASVTAIEARDPSTAGHSFRVAELAVRLAEAVDRTQSGAYASVSFTPQDFKELRYAAILHDFGKVGVRESVLVKAKKLSSAHVEAIRQRVEAIRQGIELRVLRAGIRYLLEQGREGYREFVTIQEKQMQKLTQEIDGYLKLVLQANEPSIEPRNLTDQLQAIALRQFQDHVDRSRSVLTAEEAAILSVTIGSINPEERAHIESHVSHSYTYLSQIPWTRELQRVPEIAFRHHERLNGTGYPRGLRAGEIPLQSRILMICDIFDALTAADRPYKNAVSIERALDVLRKERQSEALDGALVDIFIEARVYECLFAPKS